VVCASRVHLQVQASLQLPIYTYATAMNGLADEQDLRLRFDVLTTTRDRATNVRLYRLAAELLGAGAAACSRPASAGTVRTARCGAGAGRGADRSRPRKGRVFLTRYLAATYCATLRNSDDCRHGWDGAAMLIALVTPTVTGS
jgi:hypothetical protein